MVAPVRNVRNRGGQRRATAVSPQSGEPVASREESEIRTLPEPEYQTLDPRDWDAFRVQAHRMLDDILDFT